jgi:hypothetical protein
MNRRFKIVADGPERWREAGDFDAERRRVSAELAQCIERAGNSKSCWQRLWLYLKLRRAVAAEMEKKFPPGALHVHIR